MQKYVLEIHLFHKLEVTFRFILWKFLVYLLTKLQAKMSEVTVRRVSRYQRGNKNPQIEGQTTQWPKEKRQKNKQQSTNSAHKAKDRVTRTPQRNRGELMYTGSVGSSCSTSGTGRAISEL